MEMGMETDVDDAARVVADREPAADPPLRKTLLRPGLVAGDRTVREVRDRRRRSVPQNPHPGR